MDIEENNFQLKKQQQHIQVEEQHLQRSKQFVVAGQILESQDLQKRQYDSSSFLPSPNGLICLYTGFPTVSTKKNVTTLLRFPVQYLPVKNDLVIGIIKIRTAETFILDIGAPMDAILGGTQFDGVTKRNKPNLKVGASVFTRVVSYSKHTGGKVSCINKGFSTKNNNQMGQLKQGFIFEIPQYRHQNIQSNILQRLGKCVKFEVAFGKNGRIWIKSARPQNTMLIYNIFKLCAYSNQQQKVNTLIALIK